MFAISFCTNSFSGLEDLHLGSLSVHDRPEGVQDVPVVSGLKTDL